MSLFLHSVVKPLQCVRSDGYIELYCVFLSGNYTAGACIPTTPRIHRHSSLAMGISHFCVLRSVSGVQTSFNMEYLPEAFASTLPVHCSSRVMVPLEVFDE